MVVSHRLDTYAFPSLCVWFQLYSGEFELFSQTEAPSEIYQIIYNEPKEELIVCGNGYLQVSWDEILHKVVVSIINDSPLRSFAFFSDC